ncbi:MAG: hypothetical protein RMI90_01585, partial [Thermoguttaceae bacterium]|nr:hypothetical protein [Thermoguttaceae bacterium]
WCKRAVCRIGCRLWWCMVGCFWPRGSRLRVLARLASRGTSSGSRPGSPPAKLSGKLSEQDQRRALAQWAKHCYLEALQATESSPARSGSGRDARAPESSSALLPWREQALRELALLIEGLAEWEAAELTAVGSADVSSGSAGSAGVPAVKSPPHPNPLPRRGEGTEEVGPRRGEGAGEKSAAGQASRPSPPRMNLDEVRKRLFAGRAEALGYWVELIEKFPTSPYLPEALYHAGRLSAESAFLQELKQTHPERPSSAQTKRPNLAGSGPPSAEAKTPHVSESSALSAGTKRPNLAGSGPPSAQTKTASHPASEAASMPPSAEAGSREAEVYDVSSTKIKPRSPSGETGSQEAEAHLRRAFGYLERLVKEYPQSPWTGPGYFRLIDIALEQAFDVGRARRYAELAVEWAKAVQAGVDIQASKEPPWVWPNVESNLVQKKQAAYECFFRAAVAAHLAGEHEKAIEWLNLAGPKAPPPGFTPNPDYKAYSLYYLVKTIREKKGWTDQRALQEAEKEEHRMLLRLGDLYLQTLRPEKAEEVFRRVLAMGPQLGRNRAGLETYAMIQLAVALDRQLDPALDYKRPQALVWLERAARRPEIEGTYWGGTALFYLGLFTYNQTQDPKRSMPIYAEMIRKYPDHPEAEVAHYFYCLDAMQVKDFPRAAKAVEAFLAKYPHSEFRRTLQTDLEKLQRELQQGPQQ